MFFIINNENYNKCAIAADSKTWLTDRRQHCLSFLPYALLKLSVCILHIFPKDLVSVSSLEL